MVKNSFFKGLRDCVDSPGRGIMRGDAVLHRGWQAPQTLPRPGARVSRRLADVNAKRTSSMIRHIAWALMAWLVLGNGPLALAAPSGPPAGHPSGLATVSTPRGFTIYCEIADTPATRSIGLMYRTHMAPDRGMLFLFPEAGHWTFWMKNTKMPLDILWLDQDGNIVHRADRVPMCERTDNLCPRYRPNTAATQVLELRAGQADALNLTPGTQLTIAMPK